MKLRTSLKYTVSVLAAMASCAIAGQSVAADAAVVGNVQNARDKVSMCIGCHGIEGYKATFPELYHVPMIAGQNAKYIETALNEYKKGARSIPRWTPLPAACPTRTSPIWPRTTRISSKGANT